MKTINRILFGLCALLVLAACSDSDGNYAAGPWNAAANYAKVAFAETTISEELDPSDPCEKVITLTRQNTEGELTVPITIVSNPDDVFMLSPVTFADGEAEAELYITFENAEVGKEYTLELAIEGEQYVSFYSADVRMKYSFTRVKWNPAGFYYDDVTGEKVEGMAMYTDDLVNAIFGVSVVGKPTYPVPVEERDDRPGYYRIVNAYGEYYPLNEDGDYDPDVDTYIFVDATRPDSVYIPISSLQSTNWGYGNFYVWSEAAWQMANNGLAFDEVGEFLGTYENGKITFPVGSLIFGMTDLGGTNSNNNGAFCLVLDPDKDIYNADIETDFEWEEYAPEAEFTSNLYDGYKKTVALYKGTCTETKDDCDKRFAEEYGTPYMIESPYAEGVNIIFCVNKNGKIVVPAGYEKQPTGEYALNKAVYATITTESSYEEKVITLNINFTDEDGEMMYGNADEVLELWQWNPVGVATYTYTSIFAEYDQESEEYIPTPDEDLELLEREDGGIFRVSNWGAGIPFEFTWDRSTNEVNVIEKVVANSSYYGDIYVTEMDTRDEPYEEMEEVPHSDYDAEHNTFNFCVAYYVADGIMGYDIETMSVEFTGQASKARGAKKTAVASTAYYKGKKLQLRTGNKKALKGVRMSKSAIRQRRNVQTPVTR